MEQLKSDSSLRDCTFKCSDGEIKPEFWKYGQYGYLYEVSSYYKDTEIENKTVENVSVNEENSLFNLSLEERLQTAEIQAEEYSKKALSKKIRNLPKK